MTNTTDTTNTTNTTAVHPKTKDILNWFEAINRIPRCSKNEMELGRWLLKWASDNGFNGEQDKVGNLRIDIPASVGYEKSPAVIFQGHLDMVCEKTPDSDHDFTKDPIKMITDGQWLKGDKTTLGADNGIAIALAMEIALDKKVKHPALELLFTVDEETGLTGAFGLEPGFVKGKTLINLDSEEDGVFTVGCAGGQKSDHTFPLELEPPSATCKPYILKVGGMAGGHSADIHHEKANAIKVLTRTLDTLHQKVLFRISDIKGGTVDNAIPRDAEASIYIPAKDLEVSEKIVTEMAEILKTEFKNTDPQLKFTFKPIQSSQEASAPMVLTGGCTAAIILLLQALPHGIWAVSTEVEGAVEASNNLGVIGIKDRVLNVVTSQRSPSESRLDAVTRQIECVVQMAGGTSLNRSRYPGWQPNMQSPILAKCLEVYEKLYHKKPIVEATHGGLECGVIGSKFPGMDMISLGPDIKDPHSPDERLSIPSIGKTWNLLVALLESLKV